MSMKAIDIEAILGLLKTPDLWLIIFIIGAAILYASTKEIDSKEPLLFLGLLVTATGLTGLASIVGM